MNFLNNLMGNMMGDPAKKEEAEALKDFRKDFSEDDCESLKHNFGRVAENEAGRDKVQGIDRGLLERELTLGQKMCDRLFTKIQELGKPRGKKDAKPDKEQLRPMNLATLARAMHTICNFDQDEQIAFTLSIISNGRSSSVSADQCRNFYKALIEHSLPKDKQDNAELRDRVVQWSLEKVFSQASSSSSLSYDEAQEWLEKETEAREFFHNLLDSHFLNMPNDAGEVEEVKRKLPRLGRRSILLRDEHLWMLSSYIPDQYLKNPWKRLFSSTRHGQSFSKFMGRMIFKGPTVVVIKDCGGHVFGGYAPVSWHRGNTFFGDSRAFLFSAAPKLSVFPSSGYNKNFMWMSTNLASCTNGFGMGGQKDYWGIFLDTTLENGVCRAPCSTFSSSMPCLSSQPEFGIAQVEVWGCIPGYVADESELEAAGVKRKNAKTYQDYQNQMWSNVIADTGGSKSVLDGNLEARAVMQAAGIGGHSDDIRQGDQILDKERKAQRIMEGGQEESPNSSDNDIYEDE